MRPSLRLVSALLLLAFAVPTTQAQVSLTSLGVAKTENFDTLANTGTPAWTDNSTLAGWYSVRTTYTPGTGSSNTGAQYSFGAAGSTERALGSVGSGGTGTIHYAVRLVNNTGGNIDSLTIAYNGEQWRDGGNATPVAQPLAFEYQVAAAGTITDANTPSSGWVSAAFGYNSPKFTTTAGALGV